MSSIAHSDLQALGPAELQQRAHEIARRNPRTTPHAAYAWLRFAIEPMLWDIRMEVSASGMLYVGYFGGEARCCVPITSYEDRPAALTKANNLMNRWFSEMYPPNLTENHWFVTHVALPMEVN